jgi:orotidine-5'-phosphate decarboxylase
MPTSTASPAGRPAHRLIVALDVPTLADAGSAMDRLDGVIARYKIGSPLFTAAGPAAVEAARKRGAEVFLDLKFHDIPHTVGLAAAEAAGLGVFMFTVHASGGVDVMKAAVDGAAEGAARRGLARPLVVAVTVLTSLDRGRLARELGVASSVEGHVLHLCGLARAAGLDGCVASPREIGAVRGAMGPRWVIVTPGIRPAGADPGDQARTATPAAAARAGAHYLVVGRPVTAALDPAGAARAILTEMDR